MGFVQTATGGISSNLGQKHVFVMLLLSVGSSHPRHVFMCCTEMRLGSVSKFGDDFCRHCSVITDRLVLYSV
jgi:hypothetical protein